MKKTIIFMVCCSLLLAALVSFQPYAQAGENVYYLETEIAETERKLNPLAMDIGKMEIFLQNYNPTMDNLKSAYDDINKLEEKMRSRLAGNLMKSSVLATMDIFSALTFPVGLYKQSVKMIILNVAVQVAGNYMQGSLSDSYYNRSMGPLSKEASKLLPEIDHLQKTLALTIDDIKMISEFEGKELKDAGAVYRKFALVLEEIAKSQEAMRKLSASLTKTKAEMERSLAEIKPEAERLKLKLDGLRARLTETFIEESKANTAAMVEAAQREAARQSAKNKPLPKMKKPSIEAESPEEAYKQWLLDIYAPAKKTLEEKVPPLAQKIKDGRKQYDEAYSQFLNALSVQRGGYYSIPDDISAIVGNAKLTQLVEWHLGSKKSPDWLNSAGSETSAAIGSLAMFEKKIVEIATLESELSGLREYAQSVENERLKIYPNSVDRGHDAPDIFTRLSRKFELDLDPGIMYRMKDVAGERETLTTFAMAIPKGLQICEKNAMSCEKAFPTLLKEYEMRFARLMEDLTNLDNALYQLEGTAAAYDTLVAGSKWYANRDSSAGEHYVSPGGSGITVNLKYQFDEGAFIAFFEDALKKDDLKDADEAMNQFKRLRDDYRSLNRKYTAAWNHYFYYCGEAITGAGPYISDMTEASQVKGAMLKVKAPDIAKERALYDSTVRFRSVWSGLRSLPNIDIELEDLSAYKIYTIRKKLAREGKAWLTLNKDDFYQKTAEVNQELEKMAGGMAVEAAKKDLEKIISAYQLGHPETVEAKPPEEQKPTEEQIPPEEEKSRIDPFSFYKLLDPRINGNNLKSASGIVTLTNSDLKGNAIEFTARLNTVERIEKLLISVEDGRVWSELRVSQVITYQFTPMPNKLYQIAVKIKGEDMEEFIIRPFDNIQGIQYQNVNYQQLVVDVMKKLADAYENENVALVADIISRDFLGNRTFLEEGVRFDFDMFDNIRLQLFIDKIQIRGGLYVTDTHWIKSQIPKKTGQQQRTSGNTTMTFVLEDGRMKIQNLRGDLIYATLSPEIAESSGLSQTVVAEIAIAQQERIPVQPGAGQTQESGGVTLTLSLKSGTCNFIGSFDLATGTQIDGLGSGDFFMEPADQISPTPPAGFQSTSQSFGSISVAPTGGYSEYDKYTPVAGLVLLFKTQGGYYGKMRITSFSSGASITFEYAIQTNGTTNIRTQ